MPLSVCNGLSLLLKSAISRETTCGVYRQLSILSRPLKMFTLGQIPKFRISFKKFLIPFFIFIAVIAAVTISKYIWDQEKYASASSDGYINTDFTFSIFFQKLSFDDFTFQIYYDFKPYNDFHNDAGQLAKAINVTMGDKPGEFKVNSSINALKGVDSSPDLFGQSKLYPFDTWSVYGLFSVVYNNQTSSVAPKTNITIYCNYPSLRVTAMWIIIVLYTFLTMKFVFFKEEHPKDIQEIIGYSSLGATMLFAMTSIRSAQIGVPTGACTTDIVGFFWFNLILCFCMVCLIIKAVVNHLRRASETETTTKVEAVEEKADDITMA
ncbi:hypothetical protein BC936DRAFT_141939 [Jimgerdemannia flammicorona]|uniref:Uncharacterized protein n=1 Tax=Jimgerdemannia flammicorona TaxID=994334 RepID=A0A433DFL4_9FUNG|nr:hypothetical protein BC936DRAFT_141939 [Jimgerdemannia flammicorona]